MKILIWGYGVIGERHAKNFQMAGAEVHVLSRRPNKDFPASQNLTEALRWDPDWVFVTTETSEHFSNVKALAEAHYRKNVLIEKPLFAEAFEMPQNSFQEVYVTYNLRLHPLVLKLKDFLAAEKLVAASASVGQYLPNWRKSGKDYREFYSARKEMGGGALRDLSHELDLSLYLFGRFKSVYGHGGHLSALEINTDDVFTLVGESEKCPQVTIHMNYLDRQGQRILRVHTDRHTYVLDLYKNTLQRDQDWTLSESSVIETYPDLARRVLQKENLPLTNLSDALYIMRLIEKAEESCLLGQRMSL